MANESAPLPYEDHEIYKLGLRILHDLPHGQVMASQRRLASRYGVHRHEARLAIALLIAAGHLSMHSGGWGRSSSGDKDRSVSADDLPETVRAIRLLSEEVTSGRYRQDFLGPTVEEVAKKYPELSPSVLGDALRLVRPGARWGAGTVIDAAAVRTDEPARALKEIVYSQIESLARKSKPGTRLPSYKDLAEAHGVSVSVIGDALAPLVDDARVLVAGEGMFVSHPSDPVRARQIAERAKKKNVPRPTVRRAHVDAASADAVLLAIIADKSVGDPLGGSQALATAMEHHLKLPPGSVAHGPVDRARSRLAQRGLLIRVDEEQRKPRWVIAGHSDNPVPPFTAETVVSHAPGVALATSAMSNLLPDGQLPTVYEIAANIGRSIGTVTVASHIQQLLGAIEVDIRRGRSFPASVDAGHESEQVQTLHGDHLASYRVAAALLEQIQTGQRDADDVFEFNEILQKQFNVGKSIIEEALIALGAFGCGAQYREGYEISVGQFQPVDAAEKNKLDQVSEQIAEHARSRPRGTRLPAQRPLATRLEVSPKILGKAIGRLSTGDTPLLATRLGTRGGSFTLLGGPSDISTAFRQARQRRSVAETAGGPAILAPTKPGVA